MSKYKAWRMTVLAFGVLTLMAMISGCTSLLPDNSGKEAEATSQALSGPAVGDVPVVRKI